MILTKSMFLEWLDCPGYCWLQTNDPDQIADVRPSAESSWGPAGSEIETLAQQLFPQGELVSGRGQTAVEQTEKYLRKQSPAIFQATVITTGNLMAMADILARDGDGWILYEVKSKVEVDKKRHLPDLAFQRFVFTQAGFKIKQVRLVHINKEYVGDGQAVDPEQFFVRDSDDGLGINLTEPVKEHPDLKSEISRAQRDLGSAKPASCTCRPKTRANHCLNFARFHPDIPEPSIYDITRITTKKIAYLLANGAVSIDQAAALADEAEFTDRQLAQIELYPDKERVQWPRIAHELKQLTWPLYFFDYEAFSAAVPLLAGSNPYDQVPFLYSLLRLDRPEAEPKVIDNHLVDDQQSPLFRRLADSLVDYLGEGESSIIVWHAQFEKMVNRNLSKIYPDLSQFFDKLNGRIYDLETIFAQGFYQSGRLAGRTSVKIVTEHLVPELDYQAGNLAIRRGDEASWRWLASTKPGVGGAERRRTFSDLKKYCQQDTLVMVRIYQYLESGGQIRRGQIKPGRLNANRL